MKKKIITALQIAITVAIFVWLFHDKQKRDETLQSMKSANLLWILAGIAAYGIVELLGATRWYILLRVQGITVPWLRLVRLLMIGILFNPLLPGGTGGDVVKIFFLLKETADKKTQALLAVLMDRLIGLVGLIIVAGTVIIWKWDWLTMGRPIPPFEFSWFFSFSHMKAWLSQIPPTTQLLYTLLFILGGTVFGLIFSFIITGLGIAHKLPAKFPKRDVLIDLTVAYNMYAKAWPPTLLAIFLSFGVHIFSFLMFYAGAKAVRETINLIDFCAIMPIVNTLTSLPISVGGAGVREGLFQTLLHDLSNVPGAHARAISLLGYAMMVFWALIGGIVYLTYRPSEHARLSEMQDQVHQLEHDIAEEGEKKETDDQKNPGKEDEEDEDTK